MTPELVVAVVIGLLVLVTVFKVLKFAIKTAFLVAVLAAGVAAYLTYTAT